MSLINISNQPEQFSAAMDQPLLKTTSAAATNFVDLPTDAQISNSCEQDSQSKAQPDDAAPADHCEGAPLQKGSNSAEGASVPLSKYQNLKRKFSELQKEYTDVLSNWEAQTTHMEALTRERKFLRKKLQFFLASRANPTPISEEELTAFLISQKSTAVKNRQTARQDAAINSKLHQIQTKRGEGKVKLPNGESSAKIKLASNPLNQATSASVEAGQASTKIKISLAQVPLKAPKPSAKLANGGSLTQKIAPTKPLPPPIQHLDNPTQSMDPLAAAPIEAFPKTTLPSI